MRSPGKSAAVAGIIIVNFIWGFAVPFFKLAIRDVSPLTFSFLRTTIAVLVLLPFGLRRRYWRQLRDNWRVLLAAGLTGVGLTQTAYIIGLKLAPGATVAILSTLGSSIMVLMSWVFLSESVGLATWAGLAVATGGAAVIIGLSPGELGGDAVPSAVGSFAVLAGWTSWSAFNVVAKRVVSRIDPVVVAGASLAFAWPALLLVAATSGALGHESVHLSAWAVVGLIYAGVLHSAFGLVALNWSLQRLEVSRVAILNFIAPVVGVFASWSVLGEPLGIRFAFGAILVLLGTLVATMSNARRWRRSAHPPRSPGVA